MMREQRRGPGRPRGTRSLSLDLGEYLLKRLAETHPVDDGTTWPSAMYLHDPVAFFASVLLVTVWSAQIEVAEAVRDNPYVAVKGGRKVGKSELMAMLAIWLFCTVPNVCVWILSTKKDQGEDIIWKAIQRLCRQARVFIGEPAQKGQTGLKSPDGSRMIKVIAASETGARGHSGPQAYLIDEAADVPDGVFDVIDGNLAGGEGHVCAVSQPLHDHGRFYDAFHAHSKEWKTFTIRSIDTPNFVEDRVVIRFLAGRPWEEQMARKHGRESIWYKQNILGDFVEGESSRINKRATVEAAQAGWNSASGEGPLFIGVDPAGEGVGGDRGVFAGLRGYKLAHLQDYPGMKAEAYGVALEGHADAWEPNPRETIVVAVDAEGQEGTRVLGALKRKADDIKARTGRDRFIIFPVHSGRKALRQPYVYEKIRDELWHVCSDWLLAGGTIPPEAGLLAADLCAPLWDFGNNHLAYATHKDDIKKTLGGRSPDFADALCLAVWAQTARQFQRASTEPDPSRPNSGPPPRARPVGEMRTEAKTLWDTLPKRR